MKFGPNGSESTTTTQSPYDLMLSVAQASGISGSTVTSIQQAMGLSPQEMTPYIVGLASAQEANPAATPGQLAASVVGATPSQSAAIDGTVKANAATKGQTGAFTDIFGDLFEVVYPFFMFTLGGFAFLAFLLITVAAIAKSPTGKGVLSGVKAGAAVAAL